MSCYVLLRDIMHCFSSYCSNRGECARTFATFAASSAPQLACLQHAAPALKQHRPRSCASPHAFQQHHLFACRLADVVAGPDAYRDLPRLIAAVRGGAPPAPGSPAAAGGSQERHATAMNVQLSLEETYGDVTPTRPAGAVSAFTSIMRGCNNMCAFCVVPFTRGRERSRAADSILRELETLAEQGVREVTLLGQNVNSYADFSVAAGAEAADGAKAADAVAEDGGSGRRASGQHTSTSGAAAGTSDRGAADPFSVYARGFRSVYRPQRGGALGFAGLLEAAARVHPELRLRFTSPHPKDFNDEVLHVIAAYPNVCKQLHMPAQSGNSSVLDRMKRGYTREAYDALVDRVQHILPGAALSTDMIVGT